MSSEMQKKLDLVNSELQDQRDLFDEFCQDIIETVPDYDPRYLNGDESPDGVRTRVRRMRKDLDIAESRLKQYEDCISLTPWSITSLNITEHQGFRGQHCEASIAVTLDPAEAARILEKVRSRDKGQMIYGTVPVAQPKDALARVKAMSAEDLKAVMGFPAPRVGGIARPGVELRQEFVDEPAMVITAGRAVGKSTAPGLSFPQVTMESTPPDKPSSIWKRLREGAKVDPKWTAKVKRAFAEAPPMNESPAARGYSAMEDAVIVLRAKLLEDYPECLVDDLLLQPLRDVIGEDWFEMLVDNTDVVLETKVRMIPK